MLIHFSKYQGTGNDFILIDNRKSVFQSNAETVKRLCDRKFGIGSDGLMLIEEHPELDYRMIFFNPDGSKSLCGNGSRCGFAFARALGIVSEKATFETTDGVHKAIQKGDEVSFSLFDQNFPEHWGDGYYLNTGSPHVVQFVSDVESENVVEQGRIVRNSDQFVGQNGTNVNFAQLLQDRVHVRTYERGVEDETLSCGTGVTAVGLVAAMKGFESPVKIETEGGELHVAFEKTKDGFKNIWLTGPATHVYDGTIEI